jgi:hypothetical protein
MNEHFSNFMAGLITIGAMAFVFVLGYLMGYNDAKEGR